MVASGRWQRMLRGVYLVHSGAPTRRQWQRAGLLYGRDGAQLTGCSALLLYGLRYLPEHSGRVHLLVPASRQLAGNDVVRVYRSHEMPASRPREGLSCSPPEHAALLACREVTALSVVRAMLSEVVQRRLSTVERLEAALVAAPSAGSALPRRVLGELRAGCRSAPECELRDIVVGSRRLCRGVRWNHRIRVGDRWYVADACWPHLKLVIEVDSVEHHGFGDGPERTSRRRLALMADGWTVVSVSPRRIRDDATALLVEIESVHRRLETRVW